MNAFDPSLALAAARSTLDPVRDILDARVEDASPPAWCEARGWTSFLRGLDDDALRMCERDGLAAHVRTTRGAPSDLVALAADVTDRAALPKVAAAPFALSRASLREVSARKQEQLGALLGAIGSMADRAARIVDVGAGSGHFSRLAAGAFEREVLGIERDRARVAAAEARVKGVTARFIAIDAVREPLDLAPSDLAVGLHACGELGDRLAITAGDVGCDLALVSCCLQKIGASSRAPLSRAAAGFALRKDILGLTNLTSSARGVEATIEATIAGREARFALLSLLRDRGVDLAPGEEMRGVNRRRSRGGLADIARRALAQRGLAAPSDAEIAEHEARARRDYGVVRRLSLPRSMLARLVEVAVVLDRASAVAERGLSVRVATIAERAATPRNIALFASREARALPSISS